MNASLVELLQTCQLGDAGLVEGDPDDTDEVLQGLYVETPEDAIVSDFIIDGHPDGSVMFLVGSAGDGKTALMNRYYRAADARGVDPLPVTHRDATESYSRRQTYADALSEVLQSAQERLQKGSGPRTVVAINMGLAIDFFERQQYSDQFPDFWDAIQKSQRESPLRSGAITALNLTRRQLFDTRPDRLGEGFLLDLLGKFNPHAPSSPFGPAFEQACAEGDPSRCILITNMEMLADETVRRRIAAWLAAAAIAEGIHFNPRLMLHTVARLVCTPALTQLSDDMIAGQTTEGKLDLDALDAAMGWNQVFNPPFRGDHSSRTRLDPLVVTSMDLEDAALSLARDPDLQKLDDVLSAPPYGSEGKRVATHLRRRYLRDDWDFPDPLSQEHVRDFLAAYALLRQGHPDPELRQAAARVVATIKDALGRWAGGGLAGKDLVEVTDGLRSSRLAMYSPQTDVEASDERTREANQRESRPGILWIVLTETGGSATIELPVTLGMYSLLADIQKGYRPSGADYGKSAGLRLLATRLGAFTRKRKRVDIVDRKEGRFLRLADSGFGNMTAEVDHL